MSNLARQEIYFGKRITLAEILKGIDAVTPEAVHELAKELFTGAQVGLAAVGKTGTFRMTPKALAL